MNNEERKKMYIGGPDEIPIGIIFKGDEPLEGESGELRVKYIKKAQEVFPQQLVVNVDQERIDSDKDNSYTEGLCK